MEDVDQVDETDGTILDSKAQQKRKEELVMEIDADKIEEVKEACIRQNYPLIEEYDFKRDKNIPDLKIELKSTT